MGAQLYPRISKQQHFQLQIIHQYLFDKKIFVTTLFEHSFASNRPKRSETIIRNFIFLNITLLKTLKFSSKNKFRTEKGLSLPINC